MIGLGGPFWFDVARRLSAVRQKLGGGGGDKSQTPKTPAPLNDHNNIIEKIAEQEPTSTGRKTE